MIDRLTAGKAVRWKAELLELLDVVGRALGDGGTGCTVTIGALEVIPVEVVELNLGTGPIELLQGVPSGFLHGNEACGAGAATAPPARKHTSNSDIVCSLANSSSGVQAHLGNMATATPYTILILHVGSENGSPS